MYCFGDNQPRGRIGKAVVELRCDARLYVGEILDHSVGVQLLGLTGHCDYPVVAVEVGAFARIVQAEAVACPIFPDVW